MLKAEQFEEKVQNTQKPIVHWPPILPTIFALSQFVHKLAGFCKNHVAIAVGDDTICGFNEAD
jgi:hypothetical protein